MKLERRRDNQQWLLDHLVKTTGRVQNFFYDKRSFPKEVRSYKMIPKIMAKQAAQKERLAIEAEGAGFLETAWELFLGAMEDYRAGQHAILEDDHPAKIFLLKKVHECYAKVIQYNPYPLERVEIPWGNNSLPALFHFQSERKQAPCVIFIPGMDMVKESFPSPARNYFLQRGLHVIAIDGPGQGESSTFRKLRVTEGNYEEACGAVVDYVLKRPEVDPEQVAFYGVSMGSFWAVRAAAYDRRVRAIAAASAAFGDKMNIFEKASPRFKQMFMHMSGIHDEDAFDEVAARMTTAGYGRKITCPILMVAGEYDAITPLENTLALYDEIPGAKELWILENEAHTLVNLKGLGDLDVHQFVLDWLGKVLQDGLPADHRREVMISQSGVGPFVKEPFTRYPFYGKGEKS